MHLLVLSSATPAVVTVLGSGTAFPAGDLVIKLIVRLVASAGAVGHVARLICRRMHLRP